MTGVDAQVREEQRDELAPHGRAAVGMDRELLRGDALFQSGRRNQAFRQVRILVAGDLGAHDVAADELEDHLERVVEVRDRALELGDVPGPDLILARRHELGIWYPPGAGPGRAVPALRGPPRARDTSYAPTPGRSAPRATWHALPRATDRRSAHCAACPAWPGVRPRPRRAARARGTAAAATTAWAAAADRTRRARGRRCDTAPPSRLVS